MDELLYKRENFDICNEQEGEPNKIILREIVLVRLVKMCGLVFRLRHSRKKIFRNAHD